MTLVLVLLFPLVHFVQTQNISRDFLQRRNVSGDPGDHQQQLLFNASNLDSGDERKTSVIFLPKHEYWIHQATQTMGSLLSFVSMWNNRCWTDSYDEGTCSSRKRCHGDGGIPSGICAGGFGVCCIHVYHCGSGTPFNRTYFANPHFPHSSEDLGACEHGITKLDDICQLRLDFDVLELDPPGEDGHCHGASFHVTGTERPLPPLCGNLNGHHVYLSTSFDPEVRLTLNLGPGPPRRWKVRVTKLRCNSAMNAPGGCLQFHHGLTGQITSFNYLDSNLYGLDYGVCVRKEKGFCAIQWSLCEHGLGDWDRRRRRSVPKDAAIQTTRGVQVLGTVPPRLCSQKSTRSPRDDLIPCPSEETAWRPFFPTYFQVGDNVTKDKEERSQQNSSQVSLSERSALPARAPGPGIGLVRLKTGIRKKSTSNVWEKGTKVHRLVPKPPLLYQQLKTAASSGSLSFKKPSVFFPAPILPGLKGIGKPAKVTPLIPTKGLQGLALGKPIIAPKPSLKVPPKGVAAWLRPKVKPKPVIKVPPKGFLGKVKVKPYHKDKLKPSNDQCKFSFPFPIPLPLPIPIPIPIVPVVVVPFPFGGGGGGGGGGGHGWKESSGWKEDGKIVSATEPFLLRIHTDEEADDGLSSFCMDWEQIPCHHWNH